MGRAGFRAFTLTELLVVIAIIGILLALLAPGFHMGWQVVQSFQCQHNLAMLYKAQASWQADQLGASAGIGGGWSGTLTPYLGGSAVPLKCPSCPRVTTVQTAATSGSSTSSSSGSSSSGSSTTADPYADGDQQAPFGLPDITIGVLSSPSTNSLLYEIPLSQSPYWTMYQTWNNPDGSMHIGANVDNDHSKNANGTYHDEDFFFTVQYANGSPTKVIVGPCDGNANQYWSDMRVCHKPIWGGQIFKNQFAAGMAGFVIDLAKEAQQNGSRKGGAYSSTWTVWSGGLGTLGTTNYGVSRGSYQDNDGNDLQKSDPKRFFLLDYPRPVADYTDNTTRSDDYKCWNRIFIAPTPPASWSPPTGLDGWTWAEVQALRHGGKANVLFCDGHIESLGPEDLSITNPLWKYAYGGKSQ